MTEAWLKCETYRGLYPGEVGVETETKDGQPLSLFVGPDLVDTDQGLLRVRLLEQAPDGYWISLPAQALQVIGRAVKVAAEQLRLIPSPA
ncbi:MAG: hypothetical protein ABI743_05535 [bacterium]